VRRVTGPTFSIRTKLLVVALAMLLIPWMGYEYARQMHAFLLRGQERALLLTARAIATVFHDRPELFSPETGVPEVIGDERSLYAYPISRHPVIDGEADEWTEFSDEAHTYDNNRRFECGADYDPESLSYQALFAYRDRYFYALLEVRDDTVVYRDLRYRHLDNSDQLRMTIQAPDGTLSRYLFTASEPGRMSVYRMREDWATPVTGKPLYEFRAAMKPTKDGYRIELRMPRYLVAGEARIELTVVDVDDPSERRVARWISTSPEPGHDKLGRVLLQSPELTRILKGLDRPAARITVIDKDGQARAVIGNIDSEPPPKEPDTGTTAWAMARLNKLLRPLYKRVFEARSVPGDADAQTISSKLIERLLQGRPYTEKRTTLRSEHSLLVAGNPIWTGDTVMGAVVIEQSSDAVLGLQNQLLENLVTITLLVFLVVTILLLTFASRLTMRIRRLRNAADRAIGEDGRVQNERISPEAGSRDELGDLSRSISGMLQRLRQHTRYLEAMPDTLAHELSNPLNVVNSSLDNLRKLLPDDPNGAKYFERAKNGITRLGSILRNLTEAANLEEALKRGERERFNLDDLVSSYVEGYRLGHPDRDFFLEISAAPLPIEGAPDHIAQMLDKLVDNALDFGTPNTPVVVRVSEAHGKAVLSVLNEGPLLPEGMQERLFDPMVSLGKKRAQQSRLGLGLYVVRLIARFHGASVEAANREDKRGAVFTVRFPLARSGS
jgi:two-component system sensor histidine kinase ChvG